MEITMALLDCAFFMKHGLETAGFSKWEKYLEHTNVDRFRGWYGCRPKICETVWMKMEQNVDDEFGIDEIANPMYLLLALRFLNAYETELELAGHFKMSEKAVRKYCGMYATKVSLLLQGMVRHFHCSQLRMRMMVL
jgi:hypothetical protein